MKRAGPPRSLYTELPRKFCFETTHNGPRFVRNSARKELLKLFMDPQKMWYYLALENPA